MDKYQQLQQQEDNLAQLGVQRGTATFCDFIDQLAAAFGYTPFNQLINRSNQIKHEQQQ